MNPTIITKVDPNGDVQMDYSGFAGDACFAEAERLRRELAELGVALKLEATFPKVQNARSSVGNKSGGSQVGRAST